MHKTYDEKYITKMTKSSYISANSNINLMNNKNKLSEEKMWVNSKALSFLF